MGNCCRHFFPPSLSSSHQSLDLLEISPSSYNPPALPSSPFPSSSRHPPSSFCHLLPNSFLPLSSQDDETSSPSLTRKDTQDLYISKKDAFLLNHRVSIEDFNLMRVLGRGTFGKVMLVELKTTKKLFAMKIMKKKFIAQKNQRLHTKGERKILEELNSPFIVKLHYAFQTEEKLYLVVDFIQGGELFFHLRRSYKFLEIRARFYASEIVLALEALHKKNIIYRDLKPENILIGADGHIKIVDFGLSKQGIEENMKTYSMCGTPEYLAPEILLGEGHDKAVDFWSLGILLYEMMNGVPPYVGDRKKMFSKIFNKPLEINPTFSPEAQSLLSSLICLNPKKRLGSKSINDIKNHPFFREINWKLLETKQIEAPFKPKLKDERDIRYFDPMFTDESIKDSPLASKLAFHDEYADFSYVRGDHCGLASPTDNDNMVLNCDLDFSFTLKEGKTLDAK